jgi:type IV fimbrial biogenesis protein FimT
VPDIGNRREITMKTKHASRQLGVTLVESLIVMAMSLTSLGAALPGLLKAADRQRLEGAAAQLETEVHYARSLAASLNQGVRLTFRADPTQTCYVVHTGAAHACQCSGPTTACTGAAQALRTVRFDAPSRLRATSNSASMLFDPSQGTVTPTATMEVRNAQGDALRLVINIMGRVRSCSTTGVPGYKRC